MLVTIISGFILCIAYLAAIYTVMFTDSTDTLWFPMLLMCAIQVDYATRKFVKSIEGRW